MPDSPYDNIAHLYDVFASTEFDVPFFLKECQKTSGDILELMVGTGRLTIPLLEAGCKITAVDNSPEMLALLREKLAQRRLEADVHEMDVRQLALDRTFDLILVPFHAFAELPTADDQQRTLNAAYRHLSENGRFICALHNPPVRLKAVDGQLKLAGKYPLDDTGRRLLFWMVQAYNPRDHLVDITEIFEEYDATGRMESRRLMELRVNFIDRATFEAQYRAAGFQLLNVYGDYAYAPFDEENSPVMIWELGR